MKKGFCSLSTSSHVKKALVDGLFGNESRNTLKAIDYMDTGGFWFSWNEKVSI